MRKLALWLTCGVVVASALVGCNSGSSSAETVSSTGSTNSKKVKIGFLVKSATENWFQLEWKFAEEAAKKYDFELLKAEVPQADKVVAELDNLKAKGAQGVIICTPDQKLGTVIADKAKENGLKLLTVDDRLVGADDKPLTDIHHLGISAYEIGKMVGQGLVDEMKARNWKPEEVGVIALTIDTLETAKDRLRGATDILKANGFPEANIYPTPWKAPYDIPGAQDAANIVLTQKPNVKKWLAIASNDDGVLGAVRATEDRKISADNMIGIGINGVSAVDDLKKDPPTGMFGSVLLSAKSHGFATAEMMYKWIAEGVEPPKETWTSGKLITRSNFRDVMKEEGLEIP